MSNPHWHNGCARRSRLQTTHNYPPMYALAYCPVPPHTAGTMPTQLWQRLRQARRYADLTQTQLATACGISRGAVALWEAEEPEHRTKPTTDHLIAVAKVTAVPLEWLLNDASELNELWRIGTEFGDAQRQRATQDVLPDLSQDGHVFLFAQTPEQIAAKLAQLRELPADVQGHLVLVGVTGSVHTAATATDALSAVVRVLTTKA